MTERERELQEYYRGKLLEQSEAYAALSENASRQIAKWEFIAGIAIVISITLGVALINESNPIAQNPLTGETVLKPWAQDTLDAKPCR
jgi:hypothetical protein